MKSIRYVAFLDILGFTKLVEDGNDLKIYSALHEFEIEKGFCDKIKEKNPKFNKEVSVFSDSIIISYPELNEIKKVDNLIHIINDVSYLQNILLEKEITMRGGIAKGELYHDDYKCFGKALLEAEKVEKTAIYPRVVIDNAIITEALENNNKDSLIDSLFLCNDGLWYVDYLINPFLYSNDSTNDVILKRDMSNLISIVKKNLSQISMNEKATMKLTWLLNNLLNLQKDLDVDSEIRISTYKKMINTKH